MRCYLKRIVLDKGRQIPTGRGNFQGHVQAHCVLKNQNISHASNFRVSSRIAKLNTREFRNGHHDQNFIRIEYQHFRDMIDMQYSW